MFHNKDVQSRRHKSDEAKDYNKATCEYLINIVQFNYASYLKNNWYNLQNHVYLYSRYLTILIVHQININTPVIVQSCQYDHSFSFPFYLSLKAPLINKESQNKEG